jgi:signal transduction histidine kinase
MWNKEQIFQLPEEQGHVMENPPIHDELAMSRPSHNEELILKILANVPVGILLVDMVNRDLLLTNRHASKLLQRMMVEENFDSIYSLFIQNLFPDDVEESIKLRNEIQIGAGVYGYSIYLMEGTYICMYIRDITENKHVEAIGQSIHVMQNLNAVFSSIRHEIGNPVSILKASLSMLSTRVGQADGEKQATYIHRCQNAVSAIEDLLGQLKSYHLYENLTISKMDLIPIIEEVIAEFTTLFDENNIAVTFTHDLSHCSVSGNRLGISQALRNIIKNSVEACAGRDNPQLTVDVNCEQQKAIMTIWDNGVGVDALDMPRVFMPFFTTKRNGTGLGLPIVKKILTQLKASITLSSTPGQGTTCQIHFDLLNEPEKFQEI